MKQLPKILLIISATMFVASLTSVGSNIHYGMLKPLSALLFIVFFILQLTQTEVEKFEKEEDETRGRVIRMRNAGSPGTEKARPQPFPANARSARA